MYESNFYCRNLPHWQPPNAEYFVTFRLKDSLPKPVINQLKRAQKLLDKTGPDSNNTTFDRKKRHAKIFKKYENVLDEVNSGPTWLAEPEVADIVKEALLYRDQSEYDLYAFCIMSNHVHMVFKLLKNKNRKVKFPVTDMLGKLKSFTGLKANQKLDRTGAFWHSESYDRVIRGREELENTIQYVLNNPVKAGLVENWKEWKYSYCKATFLEIVI